MIRSAAAADIDHHRGKISKGHAWGTPAVIVSWKGMA
jgi:hypothetical protein